MTAHSFTQARKGLLVPAVLATVLGGTAFALDRFDMGHGDIRAPCLLALGVTAFVLQYSRVAAITTANTDRHVLWLSVATLAVLGATSMRGSLAYLPNRPGCDVGWTTTDAVHVLVNDLKNPYQSTWIGKLGPEPEAKYWGYHYGPGTVLSYLPAEAFGPGGVKFLNLYYLAFTFYLIAALVRRTEGRQAGAAAAVFAVMLACLPSRVWSETFIGGATDVLPTMLMLAGLLAIHDRRWFLAGALAGYSVSCKIAPGCLLVLLLMRWPLNLRILGGVLTGLVPIILAALWDCGALANNMVLFRVAYPPDDTSLYAFFPSAVTRFFPLLQAAILAGFWIRNCRRPFDTRDLATQLFLLMVLIEVFYKEIHCNHLLWFFPLAGLLFAWGWRRAIQTYTRSAAEDPTGNVRL